MKESPSYTIIESGIKPPSAPLISKVTVHSSACFHTAINETSPYEPFAIKMVFSAVSSFEPDFFQPMNLKPSFSGFTNVKVSVSIV